MPTARIDPALKEHLKDLGKWAEFIKRRAAYKEANGCSTAEANKAVYYQILEETGSDARVDLDDGTPVRKRVKDAEEQKKKQALSYSEMAVLAKDRRAATIEEVKWVANNMMIPLDQIDPEQIPSPAAVGMLKWARTPGGEGIFFKDTYGRLIPTRNMLEAGSKYTDDGREQFFLIQRLERSEEFDPVLSARPKEPEGEPGVS